MEQNKKIVNIAKGGDDALNLEELLQDCIIHWKWFVISVIVCVGIAFIYSIVTPFTYQLSAKVLIKTDQKSSSLVSKMGDVAQMFGMDGISASDNIEDEVGVIASHTMMKQMIMDLGLHTSYKISGFLSDEDLYDNSPIIVEVNKNLIDTLTKSFSFKVKVNKDNGIKITGKLGENGLGTFETSILPYTLHTSYGDAIFKESKNGKKEKIPYTLLIKVDGGDFATEQFQKKIGIGLVNKKSNFIAFSTQDGNVVRGKDILNRLIDLYNEDALADKNKAAINTGKFIRERLDLLVQDLSAVEKSVEDYKRENQLVDISTEAELSIRKMSEMKDQSVGFEVQLSLIKMVEDYVKDPSNKYKLLPTGLGIPDDLSKEIQGYNELLLQRSSYMRDLNSTNPVIQSLNEQLDLMQKNILASIQTVRRDVLKTKEKWDVEGNSLLSRVKNMPKQEREFIEIQRQQTVKSELYLFLLEKQEENALTLASTIPKAKIIDEAFALTKPVWPRKKVILAFSLIIALLLPIIILKLKDFLTFKITDIVQLEKLTSIPVLGEVCLNKSKESVVVKEGKTSSIAELFRLIRTNIRFILTKPDEKVIIITSSISGEGKTFFVINFSMSLSLMKNKRIVMVGLDIRNPKLVEYLSLTALTSKGMTSYMASETIKPEDIIIPSGLHANLSVIPAGPVPPNPAELLLSERLDELFAYLRVHYDYIVVDSAPVGMVSDTFTLNRISDATIYLCRANYTSKSHLKFVESIVQNERLKKVSLVINGTTTKTGYGYGYGNKNK